ncbi:sigma-54-dependent transcriptional regulator [Dokdonella sp. MW10]|uniref:sigma-54-dependent transcriptional regulator n=1 Tax=Dokdonella sp. MW10 TaxID=2992926 RepID=UPI003F7D123A
MSANPQGHVLVVDDNEDFRHAMSSVAALFDCRVSGAATLARAKAMVATTQFDLVLVDLSLPDGHGFDLIDELDLAVQGKVVIVTGHPSLETAMRAVGSSVVEYLVKPIVSAQLEALFVEAAHRAQLHPPAPADQLGELSGSSGVMHDLFAKIRRIAPTDITVLVSGESGTGKELVSRALHDLSGRAGRFVAVNCGAVPEDLLSSQLFGHERGSFTGATQSHAGFFEQAQGGTIFLDEITEMPLAAQVYLLRVLETRHLTRVGGTREIPLDVRVVAATNRDALLATTEGRLREDLYYRLLEFPLRLPPLRDRRGDIPLLAQHFLDRLNERYATRKTFAPDSLRALEDAPWKGNIRELRHVVQRQYILSDDARVRFVPPPLHPVDAGDGAIRFSIGMNLEEMEREMLLRTLAHFNNNRRLTAETLGITAKTIYNRLIRYRSLGFVSDDVVGPPPDDNA